MVVLLTCIAGSITAASTAGQNTTSIGYGKMRLSEKQTNAKLNFSGLNLIITMIFLLHIQALGLSVLSTGQKKRSLMRVK